MLSSAYIDQVMSKQSKQQRSDQELAIELIVAVSRLQHSKPAKRRDDTTGLSVPQLLLLRRIEEKGETTASSLASEEQVSQQAIAQNLSVLKREGLVESARDPHDERKSPVCLTQAGRTAINAYLTDRTRWLADRITSRTTTADRAQLGHLVELLERLARRGE